ncbi:hypothetical protein [Pseudomonas vanderleydeniana]|uniref:Fap n=1 Tax=Pseudomonas vanderleydeniana TaxID=2745495 RepID=A0A9E6PGI5_9PSED|nr:hypothetical protein [Pseudomonas vanderleydeniana]QXI25795.1 hypothetical protein HU752_017630 [Pseudomonas vanderleydeniana]
MGTTRTALTRTLLIGCALGSLLSLTVQAGGSNGVIVLERTVQPQAYGRPPLQPDPNPTTVNANPSARVISLTNSMELSDGDIAGISTGSTVSRVITVHTGNMPALNNPNGLPGMAAGHGGGSGASIANTVNRGLSAGMGALNAIGKGQ